MGWQAHKVLCVSFGWRGCNFLASIDNLDGRRFVTIFNDYRSSGRIYHFLPEFAILIN
jgi:hypothetical protein